MKRRQFLQLSAAAGGSLLIGFQLTGCSDKPDFPTANAVDLQPNAFLQVTPQGRVILQLNKYEMGQGTSEGFSTLVAEELGLLPADIVIEMAQYHPDLKDPEMSMILVGGSSSVRVHWQPLREAAAVVRELLLSAAAQQWQLPRNELRLLDGQVVSADGARRAGYGEFVTTARGLPVPESVSLTPASEFRVIGKERQRVDAAAKVTGRATFGLDVLEPRALTAVLVRCPHFGGSVATVDDAAAKASPGVRHVVVLDNAVAVVGDGYWQVRQAAGKLKVSWHKGPLAGVSSADLRAAQLALLDGDAGSEVVERGEARRDGEGRFLESLYHAPFLAHATLEPQNALVDVQPDRVDVWTGCQGLEIAMSMVAQAIGRPSEQVFVHVQTMGGGFGRRIVADACAEAARLSAELGQPIRVVWSREDDTRHDFYRPMSTVRMRAQLDEQGVASWTAKVACPSAMGYLTPYMAGAMLPDWVPGKVKAWGGSFVSGRDPSSTEGIADTAYQPGYFRTDYAFHDAGVPVGFWRSVGHSQNAFFMESFVDEMAHARGQDPLAFRRQLLGEGSPRWHAALDLVADKGAWGQAAAGRFQGLAVHESFQTVVAQIAEISVDNGRIRVHKVVAAVECGTAVNPDVVRAQVEGGIIFGLTAALYGKVTLEDGAVVQSNFHDYPLLRMHEAPEIEVHIVPSSAAPTGIGEPGVPPIAPAVANAIFAATGQRLRELPLTLAG